MSEPDRTPTGAATTAEEAGTEPGKPPPSDLESTGGVKELLAKVARTVPKTLWPMLVAAFLPAAPLLLLGHGLQVWESRDAVYLNGSLEALSDPSAPFLASAGVLALLGVALVPIVIGAPVLIGGAALLGRTIAVRDAWRAALRRYFTVLTWFLLVIALATAVAAAAIGLAVAETPSWFAVGVPGLLGLLLLAPFMVALPVALLERRGAWQGLTVAYRLGRERRRIHLMFVVASCGLSALASTGLDRLLQAWPGWGDGHPGAEAAGLLASALVLAPAVLLLCAPVVYREQAAPADLVPGPDLDRIAAHLPPPHIGGRSWAVLPAPALAALLLLPTLAGPAALWANPFDALYLEGSPIDSVWNDDGVVDISPQGEGALIAVANGGAFLEVCDPECEAVTENGGFEGGGAAVVGEGLVHTGWQDSFNWEAGEEEFYAPNPDSGLYLWSCVDATDCDLGDGTQIRSFQGDLYSLASAVAPYGDGLVIASYVPPADDSDSARGIGDDEGDLLLQVCDEPTCADPRTIEPPGDVAAGGFPTYDAFLDIAVSPAGGFAVAAFDASYGVLNVISCSDAECAQPEVNEIFGEQFRKKFDDDLQARFGARIEYRPDGTPVLAYRSIPDGAVHVTDCHDAACTDFTDRTITGPAWRRPLPGLAVDSQGNPQLATFDPAEGRLVLLSCLDGGCTETVRTPLARTDEEPGVSALALDDEDRPHIVWADADGEAFLGGRFLADARYLRCAEPLCGALQTP
ncbi:hypothetical protein J0910_04070 [Nocardiopsis sp. CNT-189]|uniref:hypothetical protein n=1 Tax=Nocardiopsis oceanisediminis TaxID=2816862 RepID=UPI003B2C9B50